MNPYVKKIRPVDGYILELLFQNGERRVFDLKPYLNRGVFVRLQNPVTFRAARVVAGSVEWPGDIDLELRHALPGEPATCRTSPARSGDPLGSASPRPSSRSARTVGVDFLYARDWGT